MRALPVVLACILLIATAGSSEAEWYKWTDADGVLHITDDLGRVPEDKRGEAEIYVPTPPGELKGTTRPEGAKPEPEFEMFRAGELYGGQTLEWWKESFDKLDKEIGSIEAGLVSKRQYVNVFEGGRRFGQIFGDEDIDTYKRLKKEIVEDEKRLARLNDELETLRRRARLAGVPRAIRK